MAQQNSFARWLKERRAASGLSQQTLAERSTVSIRTIRDLEAGRVRQPREDTHKLLATALGAPIESVSGGGPARHRMPGLAVSQVPHALSAPIGRDAEIALVLKSLMGGLSRLTQVVGIAGVGKTRLAMEVAQRWHRTAGHHVLWSVGPDGRGLPLEPSSRSAFCPVPHNQPTLLVVDGVRDGEGRLATALEWLEVCPQLRVLCTSQIWLELPGSVVLQLWPLALPPTDEDYEIASVGGSLPSAAYPALHTAPAMQLMIEYIARVRPGFELTAEAVGPLTTLCRSLDGIPAAMESTARYFSMLEPDVVITAVRTSLAEFADASLRTLIDSLASSVAGLDEPVRALIIRLARFPGSWTAQDAARIGDLSLGLCVRYLRQLLSAGVIRPASQIEFGRFRVLALLTVALDGHAGTCSEEPSLEHPSDVG